MQQLILAASAHKRDNMNGQTQAMQWSDLPLVLTATEAADTLRLDRRTIIRMLTAKRLHGIKTGRDWRISRTEVARFMGVGVSGGPAATVAPDAEVALEADPVSWEGDAFQELLGAFRGGPADLSSRHHEYYAEALAADAVAARVGA
jgi:excisionase family DNA binding protein